MQLIATPRLRISLPLWARLVPLCLVMIGIGAFASYAAMRWGAGNEPPTKPPEEAKQPATGPEDATVRLAEAKWPAAGIRVEPAAYGSFTERAWRSGRLTLDESRLAHLSPVAEGVVREVKVRLGQDVKAGDVLAVLDCREVGQAKLDLVKARLGSEYAKAQHAWTLTASRNAGEMVEAMAGEMAVAEIEKKFKDRPIGDLRQQLLTAYSRRLQARAQYEAAARADLQGAVPQASVIRLRADFEAAEAAFRALCEEVKFQTGQQARLAEQKLREADTALALGKASLLMLGYSADEVGAMDPIAEGAKVSLHPIRAPFAGTVIEQHAVLAERVTPQVQMFQIADLSTLWLQADVSQKDLRLVRELGKGRLQFRGGEDGALGQAEVFYTGDLVDHETRAVTLTAAVRNPDRSLKPGMFVEVELTGPGSPAVRVPATAVQRQGAQAFVFVHAGGDEFHRVDVKLGRTSDGFVEVVEGLKPGQPVAAAGGFVLKSELFKDQLAGD